MSWTAIGLTCQNVGTAKVYQQELDAMKRKGLFPESVPVLAIEDSSSGLGSGGSTLNALLILAEHLCAKNGYTVLTPEILKNAKILIVHTGRNFLFDPCGRAFVDLPAVTVSESGHEIRLNVFIHLFSTITVQLSACDSETLSGVWVCGSDGILILEDDTNVLDWKAIKNSDIVAFTIPVSPQFATQHGVYKLNKKNMLDDVLYQADVEQLKNCQLKDRNNQLPLTLALMFMSSKVVDSLLRLHDVYPLTRCTYLGEDSGVPGFKLSLFFDFLLPTCTGVSENNFVMGVRGGSMGMPGDKKRRGSHCEERDTFLDVMPLARKLIYDAFHSFKTQAVFLNASFYHYLTNEPEEFVNFLRNVHNPLSKIKKYKVWSRPVFNSLLIDDSMCTNCVLYNCGSIVPDRPSTGDNFCLFSFFDNIPEKFKQRTFNVNLFADLDKLSGDSSNECFKTTSNEVRICVNNNSEGKYDIDKIWTVVDLQKHFDFKRMKCCQVSLEFVRRVLTCDKNVCLLPVFATLCVDGYSNELLKELDKIAETCNSTARTARSLSCIADVLGILAHGKGGLRSGPSLHRDWLHVLKCLESGDLNVGISGLAKLRLSWMDTPFRIIRAARHYEAAAQIFIRKTVSEVKNFINTNTTFQSREHNIFYGARACARIDMCGGWSDTPPITYEHGGSVLNAAIRIDGRMPVGAKTCRIEKPIVEVHCISDEFKQTMTFHGINDVQNYSNPSAPGALIAAVLVCAEVVDPTSTSENLESQLMQKFGGGFKICYWSNLPHGSGLGTSSILAGCLLASVWQAIGIEFDTSSVLHAVLYIEQLLTTGGGWQDQVGGLCPGIKIGRFSSAGQITVDCCNLNQTAYDWLNERLLLVYTGKTRLAKNLLQEVVRNWYARKSDIVKTIDALVSNAELCKLAIEKEEWDTMGGCFETYWNQKKSMVPHGAEPPVVGDLLKYLHGINLLYAGWLAGAGGGGFLYLFTRKPNQFFMIRDILLNNESWSTMTVHTVQIDLEPFQFFEE